MARYFFDLDDGERQAHDAVGLDLDAAGEIETEAKSLLYDLAKAYVSQARNRTFVATVRDEGGAPVFRSMMVLSAERIH